MEDHESGGAPPISDALRGSVTAPERPAPGTGRAQAVVPVEPSGDLADILSGTKAKQKQQGRKKRKRKRGRRVFARDAEGRLVVPQGGGPGPASPEKAGDAGAAPAGDGPANQAPRQARGRGAHAGGARPSYAALDLGTNNCRLLVAVPTRPGQFRVVDAFSRIVRLGEGLSASGRLDEAAMDRAVAALKVCADKLGARQLDGVRTIATEACRSAANGPAFLERVAREAGLDLEVIDRRTEARLAVSGCDSLVEGDTDGVVLFDIGGGSSEIALVDLSRRRTPRLADHIVSWTSLPVGVVSLAERFGGRQVTRATFERMVAEVAELLSGFDGRERLAHVASGTRFHLLGTSGTVTTLAGVHLGLARYDRRRVDGLWMDSASIDRMIETILGWDFDTRVTNPCIGAGRADLVLAGCAILEAIRRLWPCERLRVADRGLREGMLTEMMAADGVWRRRRRPRASS